MKIVQSRRNSQSKTWDSDKTEASKSDINDYLHMNLQLGWQKYRVLDTDKKRNL